MRSKLPFLMMLVGALISCKMVDAVKKRVMGAAAPASATASASAPVASASAAAAATPAGGKVVPAPSAWKVADLAVGQHATYRIKQANGSVATVEYKIVGKKGDAYWMEVDNRRTGKPPAMFQILMSIPSRTTTKGVDVKGMRIKVGGRVQEFHGAMMRAIEKGTSKYLDALSVPKLAGKPQQDKTVAAGSFKGCYKWRATSKFGGLKSTGTHWSHPAVPIMGLVKSELEDGTSVELISYGMTGAKAGF